jgi:hypothetical protein
LSKRNQGGFDLSASSQSIDNSFPYGSPYTFTLQGGTLGTRSDQVATPNNSAYSVVPYLTGDSYDRTQGVDAAALLTLTYNGFSLPAGVTGGNARLSVRRRSDLAIVYDSGALDPSTMSVSIPADTLTAGTNYVLSMAYQTTIAGTAFDAPSTLVLGQITQSNMMTLVPEPAAVTALGLVAAGIMRRRRA